MITLSPMHADSYAAFVEESIAGYARENVESGRWPEQGALEHARAEFAMLLPQGLATPGQHLFDILAQPHGLPVGYVWMAIATRHGATSAYIYDLEIKPQHRRKGYAFAALQALEPIATAAGAPSIGLNVFIGNTDAQALYRKLGYAPTNINMSKALGS